MAKVCFIKTLKVKTGTPLLDLIEKAPFKVKTPCRKGTCGKCRCRVKGEVNPPTAHERKCFSEGELAKGYRLACQVMVLGDVRVLKAGKGQK